MEAAMSCRALALASLLLAVFGVGPATAADLSLGLSAGADLMGTLNVDYGRTSDDLDADVGFSVGLELLVELSKVELGAGLEYGPPREVGYGDLHYTMLYAIARWKVLSPLYLVGSLGQARLDYAEPSSDWNGDGPLWSAGFGAEVLERLRVEALYTACMGDLELDMTSLRLVVVF
jgi:hypothetical protein